jgi:hypothetical protein
MVEVVSRFIKKIHGLSAMLVFSQISQNCFCIEKVMDQDYGSRDHDWLSVHGGLATMEQRGRFGAQEVVVITQRERERGRERRPSGFSSMAPLGVGATEIATRRRSTEVVGGASMGRWFWM